KNTNPSPINTRQTNLKLHNDQTNGNHRSPRNHKDEMVVNGQLFQRKINNPPCDTGRCIDFLSKNHRDFMAKNIPDYSTKTRCDGPQGNTNDGMQTNQQTFFETHHSEQTNANSIKKE